MPGKGAGGRLRRLAAGVRGAMQVAAAAVK